MNEEIINNLQNAPISGSYVTPIINVENFTWNISGINNYISNNDTYIYNEYCIEDLDGKKIYYFKNPYDQLSFEPVKKKKLKLG